MKLRHLSFLATLVPLGAAQSPEFLEYHSLCSGEETEGTRTFDNGVTSEYTCRIKASGNINRQETMESAEECASKCGKGCPGAVWEYTKNNCIIYDSPVTLTPHGRGSVYLKPIHGAQDHGEESSSTSECLHEKQACEDELTHQLGISSRCQSEKEALALESQQCQERNDDLDAQSKTCQRERDGISTKLQDCNSEKDGLETENKSCKREKDELDTKSKTCQREKDELDTKSKTCQREKDELDTKSKTCQREKDELDTKSKTCQREKDELDSNWKAKYEKEVNGVPLKGSYGAVLPGFYWAPNPMIIGKFPGVGTGIWQLCANACERDTSCRASVADYSTGTCYKTRMPAGGFTTKHLQDSIGGRYGSYVK